MFTGFLEVISVIRHYLGSGTGLVPSVPDQRGQTVLSVRFYLGMNELTEILTEILLGILTAGL